MSQSNVVPLRAEWDPFGDPRAPLPAPRRIATKRVTLKSPPSTGGLFTREEAAAYLSISVRTLDKLVQCGVLKYWKPPHNLVIPGLGKRLRRIRKDHLEALIQRWTEEGKGQP